MKLQGGGAGVEFPKGDVAAVTEVMLVVDGIAEIHARRIIDNARTVQTGEAGGRGVRIVFGFAELNAGVEVVLTLGEGEVGEELGVPLMVPTCRQDLVLPIQPEIER